MSFKKKTARLFFLMTLCPFFSEWGALFLAPLTELSQEIIVSIATILFLMCHCWVDIIIPIKSIYLLGESENRLAYSFFDMYYSDYYRNEKPVRRSVCSGIRICVIAFLIVEVALSVVPVKIGIMLPFHACSIFYLILGVLNVLCYDRIRFDEEYRSVVEFLEEFRKNSVFGFIALRTVEIRSGFINYPLIYVAFWMLGFIIAKSI